MINCLIRVDLFVPDHINCLIAFAFANEQTDCLRGLCGSACWCSARMHGQITSKSYTFASCIEYVFLVHRKKREWNLCTYLFCSPLTYSLLSTHLPPFNLRTPLLWFTVADLAAFKRSVHPSSATLSTTRSALHQALVRLGWVVLVLFHCIL